MAPPPHFVQNLRWYEVQLRTSGACGSYLLHLPYKILVDEASAPSRGKVMATLAEMPQPMKFDGEVPEQISAPVSVVRELRIYTEKVGDALGELAARLASEKKRLSKFVDDRVNSYKVAQHCRD